MVLLMRSLCVWWSTLKCELGTEDALDVLLS